MLKNRMLEPINCSNNVKKICTHWCLLNWRFSEIFRFLESLSFYEPILSECFIAIPPEIIS